MSHRISILPFLCLTVLPAVVSGQISSRQLIGEIQGFAGVNVQGNIMPPAGGNPAYQTDKFASDSEGSRLLQSTAMAFSDSVPETYDIPHVNANSLTMVTFSKDAGAVWSGLDAGGGSEAEIEVLPSVTQQVTTVSLYVATLGAYFGRDAETYIFGGAEAEVTDDDNPVYWLRAGVDSPANGGANWNYTARYVGADGQITDELGTFPGGVNKLIRFQTSLGNCGLDLRAEAHTGFSSYFQVPFIASSGQAGVAAIAAAWSSCQQSELFSTFDLDGDGDFDVNDLNQLAIQAQTVSASPDRNGDGTTDLFDVTQVHPRFDLNFDQNVTFGPGGDSDGLIFDVLNSLYGDSNLDGCVDSTDFNAWNAHKFQTGAGWGGGDFNGDGITDNSDFNIWNANKYMCAAPLPSVVPEPTGYWTCLLSDLYRCQAANCLPRRKCRRKFNFAAELSEKEVTRKEPALNHSSRNDRCRKRYVDFSFHHARRIPEDRRTPKQGNVPWPTGSSR